MTGAIEQPGFLFTVLMFVLMIGPLVAVHEFGHYLMGRAFGTRIDSFSLGFGKRIASWTDKRGTVWQVAALPLGGYVKFAGDANAAGAGSQGLDDIPEEQRDQYFAFKPLWQRALIVVAGPLINFLFAILIFAAFLLIYGHSFRPPVVAEVMPDSAAAEAGLQSGDRITAFGGREIESFQELVGEVTLNPGNSTEISYVRGDARFTAVLTPKVVTVTDAFGNEGRVGQLGVVSTQEVEERSVGPGEALVLGTEQTFRVVRSMVDLLGYLIAGDRSVKELGGPLKIAKISGEVATAGPPAFISLMALISINLGFINLLPIPMLDGGHLALYAAEGIRGRPLPEQAQQWAFMAGFALVISFMLVVTVNDLASFGVWQSALKLFG